MRVCVVQCFLSRFVNALMPCHALMPLWVSVAQGAKKKERRRRQKQARQQRVALNKSKDRDYDSDSEEAELSPALSDNCVKVYASITEPDYSSPWSMMPSTDVSGSGFVITGRRVLTNAHVVEAATFVAVRRSGDAQRYVATVVSISWECDLAVLVVEDPAFFKVRAHVCTCVSEDVFLSATIVAGSVGDHSVQQGRGPACDG